MQDWCDKLPDPDATSLITREVKKIVDAAGTKGIAIKPGDVAYMRIYELTRHCESNNMGYGPLNGEHQWSADVVADDLSTDFIPAPKFLHIVAYLHKKIRMLTSDECTFTSHTDTFPQITSEERTHPSSESGLGTSTG
eukprot:TRINITY_DN96125_c0_g1_i1.p2 TRINITY_DN96125_c0_g1~~TRINITY_DN96125_c0_g1_i1.p2  ORF type:complete len:138 (-),score=10.06 TRINITY_DN96125_c0_g1_i1:499-912(-)